MWAIFGTLIIIKEINILMKYIVWIGVDVKLRDYNIFI